MPRKYFKLSHEQFFLLSFQFTMTDHPLIFKSNFIAYWLNTEVDYTWVGSYEGGGGQD
jgi:hypothetical protein